MINEKVFIFDYKKNIHMKKKKKTTIILEKIISIS